MIRGIIFHTLKGINGWSNLSFQKIDVAKVLHLECIQRSYKFRDKDYDYTLKITYLDGVPEISPNPGVNLGDQTPPPAFYKMFSQTITKRYKTAGDAANEIAMIKIKQEMLTKYENQIAKNLKL